MPSWELQVRSRFEAAHHLTAYKGSPEPVHGHSWVVEVRVEASELNAEGYALDFLEIQAHLDRLAARFHQRDINQVPPFDERSPTTEQLAEWFCREMESLLPQARVAAVTVREGPDFAATYRAE